jgi:heat shock protein HslJ
MRRLVIILAMATGMLGCGPNTAAPSAHIPVDQEWAVTGWSGGPPPNMTVTISTDALYGRAPCNRFSGKFTATHSENIQIGPLAVTRMTCSEISIETAILNDLSRMNKWSIVQTELRLRGSDGQYITLSPN